MEYSFRCYVANLLGAVEAAPSVVAEPAYHLSMQSTQ